MESAKARAVVIGVAETQFAARLFPRLPGVPADVRHVSELLKQRGFDVLAPTTSSQLTAGAIQDALVRLIKATEKGELAVIYFSGHGYQYSDLGKDETDFLDEAFVCSDQPLPDDWFRDSLWPKVNDGARVVAVADACHSYTIFRGIMAPPAVDVPATRPPETRTYYRLLLSAAGDAEVARDLSEEEGGLVTAAFLNFLERNPSISYRDLWSQVATSVQDTSVGIPRLDSLGPDDLLLDANAFNPIPINTAEG